MLIYIVKGRKMVRERHKIRKMGQRRLWMAPNVNHIFQVRPIVATFRSVRDKENILRHTTSSRILRGKGISVTEDFSNKRQAGKDKGTVELKKTIKQSEVKNNNTLLKIR